MRRRWSSIPILAALILALGAASLWTLWEQDIGWQVRAGNDLLRTWRFPTVDSWSFTAAGAPWHNFEWLGTVVLALAHDAGGVAGVIYFRAALAVLLLVLAAATVRRVAAPDRRLPLQLLLLPVVYAAASWRIQARPDFLVLLAFAAVVLVWTGPASPRRQAAWSVALVLLSANLHPGAALFVGLAAATLGGAALPGTRARLAYGAALAAAFFLVPYPADVVPFLWRHVIYHQATLLPNPDHAHLAGGDFAVWDNGFAAPAWAALLATGLLGLWRAPRLDLPPAWRDRRWTLPPALLLAAMSVDRQRVIPYHAVFLLPPAAALLGKALAARPRGAWALAAAAVLGLAPLQAWRFPFLWGVRENPFVFPLGSAAFIARHQLPKNLLHMPPYGDFLLGRLPDYPTFFDGREVQFDDLQPVYRQMFNLPALTAEVVERYGVRTALLATDFLTTAWTKDAPPWGRREAFFPAARWAVVHFDRISTVLVDRTAVAPAWLAEHEYRLVAPDVPPWFYVRSPQRTPELDARFAAELARCREEEPEVPYCIVTEAQWLRRSGDPAGVVAARTALEAALAREPAEATLEIELAKLYRKMGLTTEAATLRARIAPEWRALADQDL